MQVIIYDTCPTFKAEFSNGKTITDKNMEFQKLCDKIDSLGIDKKDIIIYDKFMNRVYL